MSDNCGKCEESGLQWAIEDHNQWQIEPSGYCKRTTRLQTWNRFTNPRKSLKITNGYKQKTCFAFCVVMKWVGDPRANLFDNNDSFVHNLHNFPNDIICYLSALHSNNAILDVLYIRGKLSLNRTSLSMSKVYVLYPNWNGYKKHYTLWIGCWIRIIVHGVYVTRSCVGYNCVALES